MPESSLLHVNGHGTTVSEPRPLVMVACTDGVFSLVAGQPLTTGQRLFRMEGVCVDRASRYSVQIGRDVHLDLPGPPSVLELEIMREQHPWRFMNHGCEPNARIQGREIFALRDIAAGEQVTFDYNTTEWEMAETFRCHCGAAGCRGEIRGYKFLSPEARASLGAAAAEYLRRM